MKRFTIRKNNEIVNTNTLLLTFNSVVTPKTLNIFYQIIQVELYVPKLSDNLTAKSLATTRATALLTWVQCSKSVAKVITTIKPVNAKIKHSV